MNNLLAKKLSTTTKTFEIIFQSIEFQFIISTEIHIIKTSIAPVSKRQIKNAKSSRIISLNPFALLSKTKIRFVTKANRTAKAQANIVLVTLDILKILYDA